MIRNFELEDLAALTEMHAQSSLPENCMPNHRDPLMLVKAVVEENGKTVMAAFLRGASEIYLLVDHRHGTPEARWQLLQELKDHLCREAWSLGLDQMTAWIPPEIDKSFSKRLEELGFQRSTWQSYTLNIEIP